MLMWVVDNVYKVQKAGQWPIIANRANNEVSVLTFRTYFPIEMWLSLFSISESVLKWNSFLLKDYFPFFFAIISWLLCHVPQHAYDFDKLNSTNTWPEWDRKLFYIQLRNSAYQHNTNKLCKMLLLCRRHIKKTWLWIIERVLFDYSTI